MLTYLDVNPGHLLSGGICCEELERCQGNDTGKLFSVMNIQG
jgi:hypothetical protein